ncbi:hypothetical protein NDU88_000846 [Pleurodeles waltl]|uniref:Uncharacterized protein n=1 Tax=Pleurodeles waltl TaxID=8319 RepID=A0AAV7U5T9_PLEWA|nr:hypothetical protein NDU88_000846 [Pleurodeles waltl]
MSRRVSRPISHLLLVRPHGCLRRLLVRNLDWQPGLASRHSVLSRQASGGYVAAHRSLSARLVVPFTVSSSCEEKPVEDGYSALCGAFAGSAMLRSNYCIFRVPV